MLLDVRNEIRRNGEGRERAGNNEMHSCNCRWMDTDLGV